MQQEFAENHQKQLQLEQQKQAQQQEQIQWDMMRPQQVSYASPAYTVATPTTAAPTTYVLPPSQSGSYTVQSAPYQVQPEAQAYEATRSYALPVPSYPAQ